jgi:histone-lysine N-methyltransferase SETD2
LKRKFFQDIIDGIMDSKEKTPQDRTTTPGTPQPQEQDSKKSNGKDSWRTYPQEKQKKIYQNTVSFHHRPRMNALI